MISSSISFSMMSVSDCDRQPKAVTLIEKEMKAWPAQRRKRK
jgi:hypothetical protein